MASFDEQIRKARREYSLADRAFQELEEGAGKDAVQINQLQEDVTRQVTAVRQTMNRIDGTIREAPASLRNPQEEMQAQQLNEKVVMLERGLDRFVGRNSSREREKQEREYLLSGAARRDQNESLQSLTREGNSLRKSEQLVDEMMRQGAETVNQLHDQRNTLKGAQRKMMDVMNTLGLSNSLMGVIERRQRMDRWFVYLGMVIMLGFLYLLYWWKYLRTAGAAAGMPVGTDTDIQAGDDQPG